MGEIEHLLRDLDDLEDVRAAIVVGRDGFVIESSCSTEAIEPDTIAAVMSSAIAAVDGAGKELAFGDLALGVLDFGESGLLVAALDEETVLIVVLGANAQIGSIRYHVKRRRHQFAAAL